MLERNLSHIFMHEVYFGRADKISRNINFPASRGRVAELDAKLRSLLLVRTGKATCHS